MNYSRFPSGALILAVSILGACSRGANEMRTGSVGADVRSAGLDLEGMDPSVAPGDDFFAFTNGAWFRRTEIPPDRSGWGISAEKQSAQSMQLAASGNPLELGAAAVFALLFVAVSLATVLAKSQLGISGIYALAAIVGISDVDPFVLNLAQGGVAGVENAALAAAILIAASSNNILKAAYAAGFAGGRATAASAAALAALALAGFAAAYGLMMQ